MAATFLIPGALRELAGGHAKVRVDGAVATLGEAFRLLWRDCPAVRDRVFDERGKVRPHVNVFVDGEDIRYTGGLAAAVGDGAEIVILPAVSGG